MNLVHRHDQHQCTDKGFSIHHLRLGPRARGSRGSPRPSAPKSTQARRFGPHGATPKKLACELTLIPIDFEKITYKLHIHLPQFGGRSYHLLAAPLPSNPPPPPAATPKSPKP